MGESVKAPWRISPLSVVAESLAFTAANLPALARWSLAPLVYGLGFHLFQPTLPDTGEAAAHALPILCLMAFVLLWIRVPLEIRISRKVLLNETPGHFYGLELVEPRTWAYAWAYVRVICLFIAVFGPGVMIVSGLIAPLMKGGLAGPELMKSAFPIMGAFVLLAALYVLLAPRVILIFPTVALGGTGRLFGRDPLVDLGRKARWRMVAVMALIWAPEHTFNVLSSVGDQWEWWKAMSDQWWFVLAGYLLGFATLVVSCVAGSVIYRRLRAGLAFAAMVESSEEPEA